MMLKLVRRDFQSIRNIRQIIAIATVLYGIMVYVAVSHPNDLYGFYFLSMCLTVFFSYGVVSQVCVVEEMNGVRMRIKQLPIYSQYVIASRYLTAFITIISLTILFYLVPAVIFIIKGIYSPANTFVLMTEGFYLLFGLLFLFLALYLPFYFGKSATAGSWAARITLVVWGLIAFQLSNIQMKLFHYPSHFLSNTFFDNWSFLTFSSGLLLFVVSYFISLHVYRNDTKPKTTFKLLFSYVMASLILQFSLLFLANLLTMENHISIDEFIDQLSLDSIEIREHHELDVEDHSYFLTYHIVLTIPNEPYAADYLGNIEIEVLANGRTKEVLGVSGIGGVTDGRSWLDSYRGQGRVIERPFTIGGSMTQEERDELLNQKEDLEIHVFSPRDSSTKRKLK